MQIATAVKTDRLKAFEAWWQSEKGWAEVWQFTLADPRTLTVSRCQHLAADIFYAGVAAGIEIASKKGNT